MRCGCDVFAGGCTHGVRAYAITNGQGSSAPRHGCRYVPRLDEEPEHLLSVVCGAVPRRVTTGLRAQLKFTMPGTTRCCALFAMIVDSRDHRFTGSPADRTNYRNAKLSDYQSNTHLYWRETSYQNVWASSGQCPTALYR